MITKTALISVYNKDGIVEFARELVGLGWNIISSGGTAKTLNDAGVPVKDVAEISGLPAVLGHRVVTLVPHIHGGLLALPTMTAELENLGYPWIDLACVDLYPLKEEIRKPSATRESIIEKTDIGGPTMLRSAAKGRRIVIADPADRMRVIGWLKEDCPHEEEFVDALAAKAEGIIADYCLESARATSKGLIDGMVGTEIQRCKYGENAWQTPAGLYTTNTGDPLALDQFKVLQGTDPSFNNWCDVDRMLQTMTHIVAAYEVNKCGKPFVDVAVKHGNPCGAANDGIRTGIASYVDLNTWCIQRMVTGDLRAIFGGLIMVNFPINAECAETILTYRMESGRRLLDGIVASSFTPDAIEMLKRKGDKCRLIANPALANLTKESLDATSRFRPVRGGFLKQPNYTYVLNLEAVEYQSIAASAGLKAEIERDMLLAWAIGSTSNSNTITLVKKGMLIGNGTGQQDRVGAAQLAIKRARDAGHETHGSVAYSDSFFPFPDGVEALIDADVCAILTTSGSVNDKKVQQLCERRGVTLYMVPDAIGRGFYAH